MFFSTLKGVVELLLSVCGSRMFGGCKQEVYKKRKLYIISEFGVYMFDAFPLTLNALVPGCCCLDAGFWWSVAIVNRSARRKLKRKLDIFVSDKNLWISYKKFLYCYV